MYVLWATLSDQLGPIRFPLRRKPRMHPMVDNFLAIETDKSVLDSLRAAAQRTPSVEEQQEQRVSFVYSSMSEKSGVTRDQVRELIAAGHQMSRSAA